MKSGQESSTAEILLKADGLTKQFSDRDRPAVSGVSLLLKEKEIAALVGGSGSGKTTLLRMLAGFEQADTGNILFREEAVKGPDDQLVPGHPSIRLVHQHFELAHRQTAYQNVSQKLRHLPAEQQAARALELLEVCRLSHLKDKKVEELSGGEKQRLALARTLAEEPKLLLLDEPFSNLDPVLKEEIKGALVTYIRREGIAAILVSHDPKDALSMADKLWVLQEGELLQEGSPENVYFRAMSAEVAALFGKLLLCGKQELLALLREPAFSYIQRLPGSLLGIRPEVWRLAENGEAHLQAEVLEVLFQGAASEALVQAGELSFSVYLPPFSSIKPTEQLPLSLQLEYIQHWNESGSFAEFVSR